MVTGSGAALLLFIMLLHNAAWGIERFDTITTAQLHEMLNLRSSGESDFLLINALDEIIYRDEFIPGSINIPLSKASERSSALGNDKNRLIITYCMGYR